MSSTKESPNVVVGSTEEELTGKTSLAQRLRTTDIPNNELLDNIGLFMTRQTLSRINFLQMLYKKIVPVHGVIMEFGVRWGQNLSLFHSLRGIHEPYNYNRRIIGFDTFTGFPSVHDCDSESLSEGDYAVSDGWQDELEKILNYHNNNSPISHKKKHELVQGDATHELPAYLNRNPQTIIALAYFDFDIYEPTKVCLEAILPYLTRGSIIAFDELNVPEFPGETVALREVLGSSKYAIRRDSSAPLTSYIVVE